MAVADLDTWKSRLQNTPRENPLPWLMKGVGAALALSARYTSTWTYGPGAGAAPTTAAVPTNATAGSLLQNDGTGLRLLRATVCAGGAGPNCLLICDRLSHQGGLDATNTAAQTTNLPTAALTRYTTGDGVMMALEIYTQIGATATTVVVNYTDQAGGASTTPAFAIGGSAARDVGFMAIAPLAASDTGVRAVASVDLLATTGTVGAFGVTLFKPLFMIPMAQPSGNTGFGGNYYELDGFLGGIGGGMPEILDGACLFAVAVGAGSTNGGTWGTYLDLVDT